MAALPDAIRPTEMGFDAVLGGAYPFRRHSSKLFWVIGAITIERGRHHAA